VTDTPERSKWWDVPPEEAVVHLGPKSGYPLAKEIEAVLQAKAALQTLEAAKETGEATKRLVRATWGLVFATLTLAVLTLVLIVVTANSK
jgi:cell division protein FtsX